MFVSDDMCEIGDICHGNNVILYKLLLQQRRIDNSDPKSKSED